MVQMIQVNNKNKCKLGSFFCVPSWDLKDDYLLIPSNSDAYGSSLQFLDFVKNNVSHLSHKYIWKTGGLEFF